MADVGDLLTSTTPEVDLPDVDLDAVVRRGTRRRVGRRIGAAVSALALLGGSLVVLDDLFRPAELQIVEQPDAGRWESLPPAPLDARREPFVRALDDGRVVVAGGELPESLEAGPGSGLVDGAVLSADRSTWSPLPDAPFPGSGVEFTVRGSILWAREAPEHDRGSPATEDGVRLARLDLDATQWRWHPLHAAPVDPFGDPTVTIIDDTVVVLGATGPGGPGQPDPMTSGAIWRDGTWTVFGNAPRSVSGGFLGVDGDHLAIVGGEVGGQVVDDTSILDLATATWRTADPMPAGPRTHVSREASAIVVDGRMFVAGGIAARGAPTPGGPPPVEEEAGPPPCPPGETDCSTDAGDGRALEPRPGQAVGGGVAEGASIDPDIPLDTPASGAAWLDLASGTWERVELPVGHDVLPLARRSDGLTAPASVELLPNGPTDDHAIRWRLDRTGEFVRFRPPDLPFPETHLDLDDDGIPVLAMATWTNGRREPDRTVAVPGAGGGFVEATLPGSIDGVTYLLVDGQLHAFGGVPYRAERDDEGRVVSRLEHDLDAPLIARVLSR